MPLHLRMKLPERNLGAPGLASQAKAGAGAGSASPGLPSFRSVYDQYFDFVWASVRRLGVDAESLDDLVQEVFIVVHAKLDTLERPEALRSWLYGVVRRTVSTYRRTKRTKALANPSSSNIGDVPSRAPTPLEQTEKNAELRLLASLLEQLDEPKREVFALIELEGMTVPEAAEALEIPLNTAYSRLRAARQAFDAALSRHQARNQGR
jgi:RNA polymerase sigma-70 factor (ECF subfamily)